MIASSAVSAPLQSCCSPVGRSKRVGRRRQRAVAPKAAGGAPSSDRPDTPLDNLTRWAKQFVRVDNELAQNKIKPKQNSGLFGIGTRKVRVKFTVVDYPLPQGDDLLVVGDGPGFGKWNPSSAPVLQPERGNSWVYQLDLPPGSYKYKLVRIKADGFAEWEAGPYRELLITEGATNPISVTCNFDAILYDAMTSQAEAEDLSSTVAQAEQTVVNLEDRQSVLQTALQDLEKFMQERDNQIGQLQGITQQINQIEGDLLTPRRRRTKPAKASAPSSRTQEPLRPATPTSFGRDVKDVLSSPELQKYVDVSNIERQVRSSAQASSTVQQALQQPVGEPVRANVAGAGTLGQSTSSGSTDWNGGYQTNGYPGQMNGFQQQGKPASGFAQPPNATNGFPPPPNGTNGYPQQPNGTKGFPQPPNGTNGFPQQPNGMNGGSAASVGGLPSQLVAPQSGPSPIESLGFAELPSRPPSPRASFPRSTAGMSPDVAALLSKIKPGYLDAATMNSLQSAVERPPSTSWSNPYQEPVAQQFNGSPAASPSTPLPYLPQSSSVPLPSPAFSPYPPQGAPAQPATPVTPPSLTYTSYPPSSDVATPRPFANSDSVEDLLDKLREEMVDVNLDDIRRRARDGSLSSSFESRLATTRVGDKLRLEVPSRTELSNQAAAASSEVMDKAARMLGDDYVSALAETRDYIRQFTAGYQSPYNGSAPQQYIDQAAMTGVQQNGYAYPSCPWPPQQYIEQAAMAGAQQNGYAYPSCPWPQWQNPASTYPSQQVAQQGVNGAAYPQGWYPGAPSVNGQAMYPPHVNGQSAGQVNGQSVNGQRAQGTYPQQGVNGIQQQWNGFQQGDVNGQQPVPNGQAYAGNGQAYGPNGQTYGANGQQVVNGGAMVGAVPDISYGGSSTPKVSGVVQDANSNGDDDDDGETDSKEGEDAGTSNQSDPFKKGSLTGIAIATTLLVAGDGCYRLAYKPVRDEIGNSCVKAISDVAAMASFFTAVGYRFW